jgi:hypothetical protein
MDSKQISIGIGLTIVFGTHVAMLFDAIPMNTMTDKQLHAVANIVAGGMIVYGIYS